MVLVTERDKKILDWINRFRYVTARQVMRKFNMGKSAAYSRLKKLREGGYLEYRRFFLRKPGIYFCTSAGVSISNSNLGRLRNGIYVPAVEHNLLVVDVSIALEKKGQWITDREIWKGIFEKYGSNRKGIHVPDGIIEVGDKRIGVEIEISAKSKRRIGEVMKLHRRSRLYDEVLYIVKNDKMAEKIKRAAGPLNITVKLLGEVIYNEQ